MLKSMNATQFEMGSKILKGALAVVFIAFTSVSNSFSATDHPVQLFTFSEKSAENARECQGPTIAGCWYVKVNDKAFGAKEVSVVDGAGKPHAIRLKHKLPQSGLPSYQSFSYESFDSGYATAVLTWGAGPSRKLTGSITLPFSANDEGGNQYNISPAFGGGHILRRIDTSKFLLD